MNLRIAAVGFLLSHFTFLQSSHSQTWRELYHAADSLKKIGFGAAMPHALELAKQALVKAEQEFGAPDSNIANILDLCAQLLVDPSVWKPMEAQPYAERSLKINEKVFGPDHPRVAEALGTLAATGTYRKNPHESMILMERARSIYQKVGQAHTREYASVLHNLAFLKRGGFQEDFERQASDPPCNARLLTWGAFVATGEWGIRSKASVD